MMLRDGCALAGIAVAACWLLFFNELRGEWAINAQYNYGYLVPLLGAALLWRRWPERPEASVRNHPTLVALLALVLVLLLLPLRVAQQANPEWRLLYWIQGFQALGMSCCLLYHLGGGSWVRFFLAPIAFMLIAVPWPMRWEQAAVQGLMRFAAGLTIETADWLGIPAVRHGNLIEVGAGVVGIDEACSGVRSLQSALMLSLFLGELHRFSPIRRVSLFLASMVFVLAANTGRTTFLVWAAAERGFHLMEEWHNTAGNAVMLVVLPGLLLLGHLMKPLSEGLPPRRTVARSAFPALPRWVGTAVLAWLGFSFAATEAWYRAHESRLVDAPRWTLAWPDQSPQFKRTEVPEKSLAILRCSNSASASWADGEGNRWSGFMLRWDPGGNSAQLARGHRPDICLPAAGARLVEDPGPLVLSAHGLEIPFRHQVFENAGGAFHVFYSLQSDRILPGEKPLLEDGSQASRLRAVLAGKRHLGQQVVELVIAGPDSKEAAVALLKRDLPRLIRVEKGDSPPGTG
jgi:exosortase